MKFLLAIAAAKGYQCRHVDFVTALLNGSIEDVVVVLMEPPERFEDGTDQVCQLQQSLYRLKQASRVWNETLHKRLVEMGFDRLYADASVYRRDQHGQEVFISVYVDDLLIAGNDCEIDRGIAELKSTFELKDLGPVEHVLGMEVCYVPGDSEPSQLQQTHVVRVWDAGFQVGCDTESRGYSSCCSDQALRAKGQRQDNLVSRYCWYSNI